MIPSPFTIVHYDHDGVALGEVAPNDLEFALYLGRVGYCNYAINFDNLLSKRINCEPYKTDYGLFYGGATGVKLQGGMHTDIGIQEIEGRELKVSGKDWLHYLERRWYPFDPTNPAGFIANSTDDVFTTVEAMLSAAFALPNSLSVTLGVSAPSGIQTGTFKIETGDTTMLFSIIETLSQNKPGFDFEIDPDRVWRMYSPKKGALESIGNLITNPSCEIDTTGWVANNGVIASSSLQSKYGVKSGRFDVNNDTNPYLYWQHTLSGSTANRIFSWSVWLYGTPSVVGKPLRLLMREQGGATGSADTTLDFTFAAGWNRYTATRTLVQNDRTQLLVFVDPGAGVVIGNFFYWDGAQLEESALNPYIDGDQESGRWEGTPHASKTYRSEENTLDLVFELGVNMEEMDYTNHGPTGTHTMGIGVGSSTKLAAVVDSPAAAYFRRLDSVTDFGEKVADLAILATMAQAQSDRNVAPITEITFKYIPDENVNFWEKCKIGNIHSVFAVTEWMTIDSELRVVGLQGVQNDEGDVEVAITFDDPSISL